MRACSAYNPYKLHYKYMELGVTSPPISDSYWDPDNRIGISDDVFVVPEWRGRGLAKFLVNAALDYLRRQGITQARLEVLIENAPAMRIYQATGHEIVNEETILGLDIG